MKNIIQFSEIKSDQKYYWYQDNHNENNSWSFCTIEKYEGYYFYGTPDKHAEEMDTQYKLWRSKNQRAS